MKLASLVLAASTVLALLASSPRQPPTTAAPATSVPAHYRVRLDTTKGAIMIAVDRDWAPRAADRFHDLVTSHYYDDNRFFRVVAGRWAQFGINGDPAVARYWRGRPFPDEDGATPNPGEPPRRHSNVRGSVAFAFAVPNGRTSQAYIALTDLSATQDAQGFVPFGRVVQGMDVATSLNTEYGETAGGGIRAGKQEPLFEGGNAYLDRLFPRLDRILRARIQPPSLPPDSR